MPTYDYQCSACSHTWEAFQSIKADPLTTCPNCKSGPVARLLGIGAGVLFKGSGFYETDYKRPTGGAEGESKSDSKKPAEASSDAASTAASSDSTATSSGASGSTSDAKPASPTKTSGSPTSS